MTLDPELRQALDQVPDHLQLGVAGVLEDATTVAHHAPAHTLAGAVQVVFLFAAATDMATDKDTRDQVLAIALAQADRLRMQWAHVVPYFVPDDPGAISA